MIKHINSTNKIAPEEILEVLRTLSDETRQQILFFLALEGEKNAGTVAKHFNLSRPTISHHLNLMKRLGYLNARKQGKEIFYSFNKKYTIYLLENFLSELKHCCE